MSLIPLVVGVLLFVRRYADHTPLWVDEQMIARNIRDHGFGDLAGALDHNQSAPLGWLWGQRALVTVFGTDEYVLRLLPLLAAIGTLVVAWLIGRRWFGPVGAVVLVGFLAGNTALIRYSTEVKQYSGDLFWTMLLLGATMLVLEKPRPTGRHYLAWWSLAALACLFSMGAMLATPVFAVVVVATALVRAGWRAGLRAALPFLVWLAAFGLHYLVSLRHVVGNAAMADFWGGIGYPPPGAGVGGTLVWAWEQLGALSVDPVALTPPEQGPHYLAVVFWSLFLLGCVAAGWRLRPLGAVLVGVVLFAYALAVAQVVPLSVRIAIWILPAVFVAIAFAADAAARLALAAARDRRPWPARAPALAGGLVGAAAVVTAFVLLVPLIVARVGEVPRGGFNQRDAIRWAVDRHRPGDLTFVLAGSGHAVAWYDPGDVLSPKGEAMAVPPPAGQSCTGVGLATIVEGYQRAIVYGYLKSDEVVANAAQLRADLAALGTVVEEQSTPNDLAVVVALRPAEQRSPAVGCYRG